MSTEPFLHNGIVSQTNSVGRIKKRELATRQQEPKKCIPYRRIIKNPKIILGKKLDIGYPESLADTECFPLFDGLLVLADLFVCQLGDKLKTWFHRVDCLRLKASGCD